MNNPKHKIYNPPLLNFISIISIAYFLYYLWWRATATLNPDFPFFSWLLWLAEAFGVFSYILFSWFTHNIVPITPHKHPKQGIKVDIFIPTYNEDVPILEATLIGCGKIRYPHTTYVLDDGNRPNVKELAARLGCEYIARPFHDHAKAGNINYALRHTDGEFIAILDADMVPQPGYLDRTLGYFEDEKLAIIQLPQEFYNRDSIQHASSTTAWHEQSLFFRVIQPGKNYSNSAFWCGSPSVARRTALNDIGGVATETITEDIHSSVRLHSRGWNTLFVNEPLAYGIAPQTIRAFLLQRLRWAQGTMQLYRSKDSPLWIPGLSWKQRLSYLSSFLAYFEAFQKFILISMPILILGFDIFPLNVDIVPFLLHWTPYFALNILANQLGGRGIFQYFKTEKYNILKTIIFIESTLTLIIIKPLKFKVTPKTVEDTVYRQERQAMLWYMAILGSLSGSMVFAVIKIFTQHTHLLTWNTFAVAFFWAFYNVNVIGSALMEVFEKNHERRQYRFPINAEGKIYGTELHRPYLKARVIDLSIAGVGLVLNEKLPDTAMNLILKIQPAGFKEIFIPIEKINRQYNHVSGKIYIGASFSGDLGPQRERLFEYLFVYLPHADVHALYHINEWSPFRQIQHLHQKTLAFLRGSHPVPK